jgi:hypothetical protein
MSGEPATDKPPVSQRDEHVADYRRVKFVHDCCGRTGLVKRHHVRLTIHNETPAFADDPVRCVDIAGNRQPNVLEMFVRTTATSRSRKRLRLHVSPV